MRGHLRAVDIANTIRMSRTHHRAKTFLAVEGDDDRAFFRWHSNPHACEVQSCYGRDMVVEVVLILDSSSFQGILGIVDADYSVLDGVHPPSSNVLFTDHHDLECMLLASPALAHLLKELGTESDIAAFETTKNSTVLDHLHRAAQVIGHLRWASSREKWALRFEGIDFSRFVDVSTLELDQDALLATIRGQQGNRISSPPTAVLMSDAILKLALLESDRWHVSRGHDLVEILAIGLQRALGGRNAAEVKPDRLELMLRLAYEKPYFVGTNLFRAMRAWETSNHPFRIF